jgi:hypothetical protein
MYVRQTLAVEEHNWGTLRDDGTVRGRQWMLIANAHPILSNKWNLFIVDDVFIKNPVDVNIHSFCALTF